MNEIIMLMSMHVKRHISMTTEKTPYAYIDLAKAPEKASKWTMSWG